MVEHVAAYLAKQNRAVIIYYAMALVALIGLVDFVTGYELRVGVFYVAPVSLAAWYAGRSSGTTVAIISGIVSLVTDLAGGAPISKPTIILWNTAAFMGFLIVLALIEVKLRLAYETLESLIQTVAHDLKSPVISIVGLARALRSHCRNLPLDERRDRILDQIDSSGQTMENFLKELLDGLVSDTIEPVREKVFMDQIVHASLQQHHQTIEERGIDLQLEIPPGVAQVWADPHRVRQVVDNILVNSIKHMGARTDPIIKVEVQNHHGSVLTRISDNGVGIPPEYLENIFDRFFRVRRPGGQAGTGLGLFIAKKIIDGHGGRIWAESEKDRGATFSFTLPKSNPDMRDGPPSQQNETIEERLLPPTQ